MACQERLMTGRTVESRTRSISVLSATCVHWRRCVGSDPLWSGTVEDVESVHGYLWEKRVPVEATFRGVWGQGD